MNLAEQYQQGISYYRQGCYVDASYALAPIAGRSDLLGRLGRYWLGRACRSAALEFACRCDFELAGRLLSQAGELLGGQADLGEYLARLYANSNVVESIAPDPGDPADAVADEAMGLCREGRNTEALMVLYQGLRQHGRSSQLQLLTGMVLAGQDRLDEARKHFLQATQCDCACLEGYRYLALCEAAAGRFGEAVNRLSRALSLSPGDLALTRELFTMAAAAGRAGEKVTLKLSEEMGPAREGNLERLASIVLADSDWAMAFLDLPVSETDEEVFTLLAEVLDTALARHDDYADIQHRQALVCERLGQIDRAVRHDLQAIAVNPAYVQARFHLGSLLMKSDPAAAADHLHHAVESGGDYADIHTQLALAYERLGRVEQARAELVRSLEINSNYTPAREALRRLAA